MNKQALVDHLQQAQHHVNQAMKLASRSIEADFDLTKREEQVAVELERVALLQKNINRKANSQKDTLSEYQRKMAEIQSREEKLALQEKQLSETEMRVDEKLEKYAEILKQENDDSKKE